LYLKSSDGGERGPAKYDLKHILRNIFFIIGRRARANSHKERKGPRLRDDGVWSRNLESFNDGVEEGRCNIHDDDTLRSRGFFGGEFDRDDHCLCWEILREDVDIFKGLEKGRGVDGKIGGGCLEMARGSEGLKSKRVPGIGA
jgi:hypothetical protein